MMCTRYIKLSSVLFVVIKMFPLSFPTEYILVSVEKEELL